MPKVLTDLELALRDQKTKGAGHLISAGCVEAIRSASGLDMQVEEMILAYSNK